MCYEFSCLNDVYQVAKHLILKQVDFKYEVSMEHYDRFYLEIEGNYSEDKEKYLIVSTFCGILGISFKQREL